MSKPALSLARTGVALIVLLAAAWLSALPYLLVRLGLPGLVPISSVDGPHAFFGLAAVGLLTVKVVDLVRHAAAVRAWRMPPWQRWLSRSLAYLYGAVVLTGVALALPWPAPLRTDLVNLHLLAAAWALLATVPHLHVHLRGRLRSLLPTPRLSGGLALVAIPGLLLAAYPVAYSPLAQVGAGGTLTPVGSRGAWMFRLLRLADGRLLAAGEGVYLSADGGVTWTMEPAGPALVFALAQLPDGSLLLGTGDGLLRASGPGGPYTSVKVPTAPVTAVYADPAAPQDLWIGGHGVWASSDGGASWTADAAGIEARGSVWTLGRHQGTLTAGTSTGVYLQAVPGTAWTRTLNVPEVVSLADAGGGLWASSMGGGLSVRRGLRWTSADSGMATHHAAAIHVTSFEEAGGGRDIATQMAGGLDVSLDGGQTWYQLTPSWSAGPVWAAAPLAGGLLLATDTGLFLYRWPPPAPAPPAWWWALLVLGAAGFSLALVQVALREPGFRLLARTRAA